MRIRRLLALNRKRSPPVTPAHEVDKKLDDLDDRLSRTVSDMAATLEKRAAIARQRDLQTRRRKDGGAAQPG